MSPFSHQKVFDDKVYITTDWQRNVHCRRADLSSIILLTRSYYLKGQYWDVFLLFAFRKNLTRKRSDFSHMCPLRITKWQAARNVPCQTRAATYILQFPGVLSARVSR